jgi:hypothetical protein
MENKNNKLRDPEVLLNLLELIPCDKNFIPPTSVKSFIHIVTQKGDFKWKTD